MRLLFTGDSITLGQIGYSYVNLITEKLQGANIVNLGLDGDTLSGIMKRTLSHLHETKHYDAIVIAAGHNDIILPYFHTLGFMHRKIVKTLSKRGSIPVQDSDEFELKYCDFIGGIRKVTPSPIIITTLSCLNENPNSMTNRRRIEFNERILAVAKKCRTELADAGMCFDEVLRDKTTTDYFMNNLLNTFLFDKKACAKPNGADRLSEKRHLNLTIDGVHINSTGAQIYRDVILRTMKVMGLFY
ncbi:MAG: SGNH/GDSL hydrolase family protein [Brevinematales bacterium]|nr:SGNH/GDSL hydrolase family protein [Brevinematales bacterium]